MHSVDILEEALGLAIESGFIVRQEWLAEKGGGTCRIGNQWYLFVDLSMAADEQLRQVVLALRQSNGVIQPSVSRTLSRLLDSTGPSPPCNSHLTK